MATTLLLLMSYLAMARVQQRDILMKELELALVCRIVSMPLSRSLVFRSSSICRGTRFSSSLIWGRYSAAFVWISTSWEVKKKTVLLDGYTILRVNYFDFILRGCWMLESDWLTNILRCAIIFREMQDECSSRQLSWPHCSSVSLHQMISVISQVFQQKNNQNPPRHWPNK